MRLPMYALLFILSWILVSCGPSMYSNIRITPAFGTGIWQEGKEISEKTVKKVRVTVTFEKIYEKDMVYDIVITNSGKTNVLFDPAKVFCNGFFELPVTDAGTQTSGDPRDMGTPDVIINANDPELLIKGVETQKVKENSSYESDQMANDAGCCIGAAGSVAADSDSERKEYDKMQKDAERDSMRRESQHLQRMEKLNEQTAYYEKETLRKTTVLPGQTVRGKIHMPANTKVKLLVLNIPVDNLQFDFVFGQVIEKPAQKQGTAVQ